MSLNWVLWCCPQCHLIRYTVEWWAEKGYKECHHGQLGTVGTALNPILLSFNPTEEAWHGKKEK